MAIIWNKIIPRWGGDTMEPPEAKKDVGYIAGDNPPAKWENWLRKGTYEALDETRDVIENIDTQLAQIELDFNLHKIQTVTHVASFTRDISITGSQILTIPIRAKSISAIAFVVGTKVESQGIYGENASTRCIFSEPDGNMNSDTSLFTLKPSNGNYTAVYIESIDDFSITLSWQKIGNPTGTAIVHLLIQNH